MTAEQFLLPEEISWEEENVIKPREALALRKLNSILRHGSHKQKVMARRMSKAFSASITLHHTKVGIDLTRKLKTI
jgi:hypothetical protein